MQETPFEVGEVGRGVHGWELMTRTPDSPQGGLREAFIPHHDYGIESNILKPTLVASEQG